VRDLATRVGLGSWVLSGLVGLIGVVVPQVLCPPVAWAQGAGSEEAGPSPESTEAPPKPAPAEGAISRAHQLISSRLTDTADRLDAFFGEPRIQEESNRSYLNVAVQGIKDEHGGEVATEFRLKIVLPRLQNRLQLVIERDTSDAEVDPEVATGIIEDLTTSPPSGDLTSAIRLMVRSARDLNIYIDAGIRVRVHPTVFSRIRYRRSAELKKWVVRFTQSVKWEEEFAENPYQWEVVSRLDFDRPIPPHFFFRTSLQGGWTEGLHGYFVTQGFSLVHQITDRRAMVYEWNTLAQTGRLVHTENDAEIIVDADGRFRVVETGVKVRYRQTIGWPWLFVETDVERAFRRELDLDTDFDGVWRLMLEFEVQFRDMGKKAGISF
jgi:hypothetical protein